MKEVYKVVCIVLGFMLNTFIGFQICPNLLSYNSNISVVFGILIFTVFVIPVYVWLSLLFINKKRKEK